VFVIIGIEETVGGSICIFAVVIFIIEFGNKTMIEVFPAGFFETDALSALRKEA